MEAVNLLLVLFSSQLFKDHEFIGKGNYFIDIAVNRLGSFSTGLVVRLLNNFIEQKSPPTTGGGVLFNAYSYLFVSGSTTGTQETQGSLLARKSVMLLLVLVNQMDDGKVNAFRSALLSIMDLDAPVTPPIQKVDVEFAGLSFRELYEAICL
jgi:hypothetical protein